MPASPGLDLDETARQPIAGRLFMTMFRFAGVAGRLFAG
jgi:hypothetical protein